MNTFSSDRRLKARKMENKKVKEGTLGFAVLVLDYFSSGISVILIRNAVSPYSMRSA